MKKRGAELTLNTVIIGILVVLVLVVVAFFFLGGTSGIAKTIRNIFYGTTAGTDESLALQTCKLRCDQVSSFPETSRPKSAYCSQPFNIDRNNDGEADFIEDAQGNKKNINYYCDISIGQSLSTKEVYDNLGQNCDLGTFSFADEKKKISFMNPGTGGVTEKEINKGAPITCTGSVTSS